MWLATDVVKNVFNYSVGWKKSLSLPKNKLLQTETTLMYRLRLYGSYIISVVLALCLELPNVVVAQSWEMNYVMREDGLSGESAQKIITDYLGRVWIATSHGVTFFNGIKATLVPMKDPERGNSLTPQGLVYDICESPADHSIFIATGTGIWQLTSSKDYFIPLLRGVTDARMLCDSHRLYISNPSGLHIYENGTLKDVAINGNHDVHCMAFGPDSTVWFLSTDAISHYLPAEGRVERMALSRDLPSDVNFNSLVVNMGKAWIGTNNYGLFLYDLTTAGLRHISEVGNVVNKLYSDGKGHLCVATDGSGAWLIDEATGGVLRHFTAKKGLLHTDAVYHYYLDAHGNHWFGQSQYGLAYTYHRQPLVEVYRYGSFTSEGLNVRSFCFDGSRRFLGTDQGLFCIDEATGQICHITPDQMRGATIITGIVRIGKRYYVGTYNGGIFMFDLQAGTVTAAAALNKLTSYAPVKTMKRSPKGELWIGTDNGVVIVDSTEHVRLLNHDNSPLMAGGVGSFVFGSDGSVWITGSKGLTVRAADGHFIGADQYPTDFFHHERYLVADLSSQGLVYFGSCNGLFYTNFYMSDYGRLPLPDGILNERCNAICIDTEGCKWFASEKGLFRLGDGHRYLLHLGYGEGFRSMLVSSNGISQYGDTLWVATADGLALLSLKSLNEWQNQRDYCVMLHTMYCGERLVESPHGKAVSEYRIIHIGWNFTSERFQTKLFLNDYAKPEGRLFEYRLNDEDSWHLLGYNDDISLMGLTIGDHKLCVRQAGVSGTETTYTLRVHPTILFYIEVLLLLIAVSLLVVWWRYRKTTKMMFHERDEIEDLLVEMQDKETIRMEAQDAIPEEVAKYQQLKMSDEECADLVSRMRVYLETERAFTNAELKRTDLAKVLHVPAVKLSYVFSMYLKENYYEYINRYRLDAFKQLIDEGAYKRFTLTSLSEQCGFKKSSFFSTFRKVEGMTPTEYLKRKNIKVQK